MFIPDNPKKLRDFCAETAYACMVSQLDRINAATLWRKYYYDGQSDSGVADVNKSFAHIEELQSYLYSPMNVRFLMEAKRGTQPNQETLAKYAVASDYLSREFTWEKAHLLFGRAVLWGLVKGSCFLKQVWHDGPEVYLTMPENIGVLREDINDIHKQEAICETRWMSPYELWRYLRNHPRRDKIMKEIRSSLAQKSEDDREMNYQIFMGGLNPIVTTGGSGAGGFVDIMTNVPNVQVGARVFQEMVRLDEIWVWDDARGDYTTLICVRDGPVIEGELRRRNLFVPGMIPYNMVCPNMVEGYIWGMSELSTLRKLQDRLNVDMDDSSELLELQVRPPRAFSGFSSLTEEDMLALHSPDSFISEGNNSSAKVDNLAPQYPAELDGDIARTMELFNDIGGLSPILQGRGEAGVRSAQHAQTLVRTSSPRLRDRSLLVESQLADFGETMFKLLQAKNAELFADPHGGEFTLSQISDDYVMTVDSHSSSPLFVQEAQQLAFALYKDQAIDAESLLELTQPPMLDTLKLRLRQRQAAQAKFMQEHPELAVEGGSHRKK